MKTTLFGYKTPRDIPLLRISEGEEVIFFYSSWPALVSAQLGGRLQIWEPVPGILCEGDDGWPTLFELLELEEVTREYEELEERT